MFRISTPPFFVTLHSSHSFLHMLLFTLLSLCSLRVVVDTSQALYGETRPYVLNYFLADDTVEVMEVSSSMSGRDPFPALLKKQRLPKVHYTVGTGNGRARV